jgi:hypothetical protein
MGYFKIKKIFLFSLFLLFPLVSYGADIIDSYPESNYSTTRSNYICDATRFTQSFTSSASEKLSSAKFYLIGDGTGGNMVAWLYAHTGTYGVSSVPTGTALATSDLVVSSSIPQTLSLVEFTFSGANQYDLISGTQYEIVIGSPVSGNCGSGGARIGTDQTVPTHSGNYSRSINYGSSYSPQTAEDTIFYVYGQTPIVTPPVTPSINVFSGGSATALVASIGEVSGSVFNGALPYFMLSMGLFIAFYILQQLIMIQPKPDKSKKDRIIRDKEGKQIGIDVTNDGYHKITGKKGQTIGWEKD